jgi:hypothetical protein
MEGSALAGSGTKGGEPTERGSSLSRSSRLTIMAREGGRLSTLTMTSGVDGGCPIFVHTHHGMRQNQRRWKGRAAGSPIGARLGRKWPAQGDPTTAAAREVRGVGLAAHFNRVN